MNASGNRLTGMEQHKELRKGKTRIFDNYQRVIPSRDFFGYDDSPGMNLGNIFGVRMDRKGNVCCLCFSQAFDIFNESLAVTNDLATENRC